MTDAVPSESSSPPPLAIEGDLTIQSAAARSAALHEVLCAHLKPLQDSTTGLTAQDKTLHLDVGALGDIDSAGLQILVAAERLCARYGAALLLEPRSRSVDEALDTFWLDPRLKPRQHTGVPA